MFHGVMDDYSWSITFLKCSKNNKADTTPILLDYALEIYDLSSGVATYNRRKTTLILVKKFKFRELWESYIEASSAYN